eukprot:3042937-Amphidinium_carterae.1
MGWSWAVLFCQSVVRISFRRNLDVSVQAISDRGINVHVSRTQDAEATYVDNFCLLSCDKTRVEKCVSDAVCAMDAIGLGCHAATFASETAEFTGSLFDGRAGSIRELVRRGFASSGQIQKVLGHYCSLHVVCFVEA